MTLLRKIAHSLTAAPFLFVLLQVPEASIDVIERFLGKQLEAQPFLSLLLLLPYFWVSSTLSTSLTFASVLKVEAGEKPTLGAAFRFVEPRLSRLLAACCLAGVVILLGLTLILPGIYFMTVYLFVPFLVLSEKDPVSPFSILNRSKKMVERKLWTTLGLTVVVVSSGLVFHFLGETLGGLAASVTTQPVLAEILFFLVKLFLSAVVGATMNVAVAQYFLMLTTGMKTPGEEQVAHAGRTA